jgi:hypothetical protein
MPARLLLLLSIGLAVTAAGAQQEVAQVPAEGLKIKGAISVQNGQAMLGSGSQITAGEKAATLQIPHRGTVKLCSTTTLRLTHDTRAHADAGLMMSLERGAVEVHLAIGSYSDVVLTPDFRILLSPPGVADVGIWLNQQGDTCLENNQSAGQTAPYVLVSDLFDDGLYRVQPGQRVQFQHGSVREVVDHYREACGCPPAVTSVADSDVQGANPARPGEKIASNNPFPLAESAGLAAPEHPLADPGEIKASVTAQLAYHPNDPNDPALSNSSPAATPAAAAMPAEATAQAPTPPQATPKALLRHIGHWFRKLFGSQS